MKDLTRFATKDFPLHPSALRLLVDCPWRLVSMFMYEPTDEGGPAANTGSAVHVAAHALHTGKEVAESLAIMQANLAQYPRADIMDAADLFLKYAGDPRNRGATVVLGEQPIAFEVAPAKEDPTQEPLIFTGTLDQVREMDGQLYVYDLKTSKKDPMELLHEHMFQMAAYCIGASVMLKREVSPGALILVRRYKSAGDTSSPVFWHYAWKFRDCARILEVIRHRVAEIRRGVLYHNPNESYCRWCWQRTPDMCLPRLQETLIERLEFKS